MPGRLFEDLGKEHFQVLAEVLLEYGEKCKQLASSLKEPIHTDGHSTVKRGLFSLRKILISQLGEMSLSPPDVVKDWKKRSGNEIADEYSKPSKDGSSQQVKSPGKKTRSPKTPK